LIISKTRRVSVVMFVASLLLRIEIMLHKYFDGRYI
jgi:hypothetical protein